MFQCRKRQCYTRDDEEFKELSNDFEFQCRKRQCYTRDFCENNYTYEALMLFQCRKRQCYTRDQNQ